MRFLKTGCLLSLGFVALIVVVGLFAPEPEARRDMPPHQNAKPPAAAVSKPPARTVRSGGVGYLAASEAIVWVASDEDTQDEMLRMSANKNKAGIAQLILAGRLLVVPKNTSVTVVDAGFMSHTVRIMDGQYAGRTGVIAREFVHAERQ